MSVVACVELPRRPLPVDEAVVDDITFHLGEYEIAAESLRASIDSQRLRGMSVLLHPFQAHDRRVTERYKLQELARLNAIRILAHSVLAGQVSPEFYGIYREVQGLSVSNRS